MQPTSIRTSRGNIAKFRRKNVLLKASQGLFIWSRVVPGRRVTLDPALSLTERLYEKVGLFHRAKTWPCRFKRLARVILKYLLRAAFSKIRNAETSTKTILDKFTTDFDVILTDCSICVCSVCVNWSLVRKARVRVILPSKRVTLHPRSPYPPPPLPRQANFVISHMKSSQLFIKKRMESSLARDGSVWRVTLRDNSPPYIKQAIGRFNKVL